MKLHLPKRLLTALLAAFTAFSLTTGSAAWGEESSAVAHSQIQVQSSLDLHESFAGVIYTLSSTTNDNTISKNIYETKYDSGNLGWEETTDAPIVTDANDKWKTLFFQDDCNTLRITTGIEYGYKFQELTLAGLIVEDGLTSPAGIKSLTSARRDIVFGDDELTAASYFGSDFILNNSSNNYDAIKGVTLKGTQNWHINNKASVTLTVPKGMEVAERGIWNIYAAYSDAGSLSQGDVIVAGELTNSGSITVNNGATLSSSSTITNSDSITVNNGATLSFSSAIINNGSITINTGGKLNIDSLNGFQYKVMKIDSLTDGTHGYQVGETVYDLMTGTGTLTNNGSVWLNGTDITSSVQEGKYTVEENTVYEITSSYTGDIIEYNGTSGDTKSASAFIIHEGASLKITGTTVTNTNKLLTTNVSGGGTIIIATDLAFTGTSAAGTSHITDFTGTVDIESGSLHVGNYNNGTSGGAQATVNAQRIIVRNGATLWVHFGGDSQSLSSNIDLVSGAYLSNRDGHNVLNGDIRFNIEDPAAETPTYNSTGKVTLTQIWDKGVVFNGLLSGDGVVEMEAPSFNQSGSASSWKLTNDDNTFAGSYNLVNSSNNSGKATKLILAAENAAQYAVINLNGTNSVTSLELNKNATIKGLNSTEADNYVTTTSTATLTVSEGAFAGILKDGTNAVLSLTKTGAETLTLSGANTYTGNTNVQGGELVLTAATALSSGSISISKGAKLTLKDADYTISRQVSGEGDLVVEDGVTLTLAQNGKLATNIRIKDGGRMQATGLNVTDQLDYNESRTVYLEGSAELALEDTRQTVGNWTFDMTGGTISGRGVSENLYALDFHKTGFFKAHAATGATAENPTVSTVSASIKNRENGQLNLVVDENARLNLTGNLNLGQPVEKSGVGLAVIMGTISSLGEVKVTEGTLAFTGTGNLTASGVTISTNANLELGSGTSSSARKLITFSSINAKAGSQLYLGDYATLTISTLLPNGYAGETGNTDTKSSLELNISGGENTGLNLKLTDSTGWQYNNTVSLSALTEKGKTVDTVYIASGALANSVFGTKNSAYGSHATTNLGGAALSMADQTKLVLRKPKSTGDDFGAGKITLEGTTTLYIYGSAFTLNNDIDGKHLVVTNEGSITFAGSLNLESLTTSQAITFGGGTTETKKAHSANQLTADGSNADILVGDYADLALNNYLDLSKGFRSSGRMTVGIGSTVKAENNIWLNKDYSILLKDTAKLKFGESVTMTGRQGDQSLITTSAISTTTDSDMYSTGRTTYTLSHVDVEVSAEGNTTMGNKLEASALTHAGSGTLTVSNSGNTITSLAAEGGHVQLSASMGVGSISAKTGKLVTVTNGNNGNTISMAGGVSLRTNGADATLTAQTDKSLLQLQKDASFSIKDMALSNVAISAANAETKVNLTNVTATNVQLAQGSFTMTDKVTLGEPVGTYSVEGSTASFTTDQLNGITLNNAAGASLTVNLDALPESLTMGKTYDLLTIMLDGFTMDTTVGYVAGKGLIFAADSWLGRMLADQNAEYVNAVDSPEVSSIANNNTVTVTYTAMTGGNVGTIITITGLTIPEPTTSTLSLLALAGLAARRRRQH